jgi:hypothetical protein
MSTAGIYNYRPKVDNPNKIFYQMESGGFQKPFFFGGSQVPINLGIQGSGFIKPYMNSKDRILEIPAKGHGLGCGLHTTHRKNDRIRLAKVMFHK